MKKSAIDIAVKISAILGCFYFIVNAQDIFCLFFAATVFAATLMKNKTITIVLVLGLICYLISVSLYSPCANFYSGLIFIGRILTFIGMLLTALAFFKTLKKEYIIVYKSLYVLGVVISMICTYLWFYKIIEFDIAQLLMMPFFLYFEKIESKEKNRLDEKMMMNAKYLLNGVNGQLYVYEDRIIIERKGMLSFFCHGLSGSKTIPIKTIQSVQFKKGGPIANGFIQFGILGGIESKRGVINFTSDENTIMISMKDNILAENIKNYIENLIFSKDDNVKTIINQASSADELKKFKDLLDSGIITQEEFEQKKKQLLGL